MLNIRQISWWNVAAFFCAVSGVMAGVLWLFPISQVQGQLQETAPPADFKIAFIGDGYAQPVYQLIKRQGASAVIHAGDFDYANSPSKFETRINAELGASFPYFGVQGNHDVAQWSGYAGVFGRHLPADATCTGSYGLDSICTYKGITFTLSGWVGDDNAHAQYITNNLPQSNSIWKFCSWHGNMAKMTRGTKGDSVTWSLYEACRKAGGFVINGHEHQYARTKSLISYPTQVINPTFPNGNQIAVYPETATPGSSFMGLSGLAGASRDGLNSSRDGAYWANGYGSNFGALFITFNVDGNPRKACGQFVDVSDKVIDEFTLQAGGGEPVTPCVFSTTPPPPPLPPPPPAEPQILFSANDRIEVVGTDDVSLNVRQSPGSTSPALGQQALGAQGAVLIDPSVVSGGRRWWNVNFDSGADGWVAQDYILEVAPPVIFSNLSFEQGQVGWIDWAGEEVIDSTAASDGTKSFHTFDSSSATRRIYQEGVASPGQAVTVAFKTKNLGTNQAAVRVEWVGVGGLILATHNLDLAAISGTQSAWQDRSSPAAPSGTTRARIYLMLNPVTNGIPLNDAEIWYDNVRITSGGIVPPPVPPPVTPPPTPPPVPPPVTPPPSATSCLTQAGGLVTLPVQTYSNGYSNTTVASNTKIDARTAIFHDKTGVLPVELNGGSGICFYGGSVQGQYPRNSTWDFMHSSAQNHGGIEIKNNASTIEATRIDNVEDGIRFRPTGDNFVVKGVHMSHIFDDCIDDHENRSISVDDTLADGCYVGVSTRANAGQASAGKTVRITNSLFRLEEAPSPHSSEPFRPAHGDLFKQGSDIGFELHNNIFLVVRDSGSVGIPANIRSCSGNTIVWLGGGNFPDNLGPAGCVTQVTSDIGVWESAKQNWISTHGGSVTPPPPPPPPSSKFIVGDRIRVTDNVNVRATANGTLLGTQLAGILGTVIGGPGNISWWNINYDSGADGWSVEDFLEKVSTVPPPTPPPVTPPPVPPPTPPPTTPPPVPPPVTPPPTPPPVIPPPVTPPPTTPPPAPNLILQNGGFDSGEASWQNFNASQNQGTIGQEARVDASAPFAGTQALHMFDSSVKIRSVYQDVSVEAGKSYTISSYFKGKKLGLGQAKIQIDWLNAYGSSMRTDSIGSDVLGTIDYQIRSSTFVAPSGASTARIQLILGVVASGGDNDAEVWIDSITFEQFIATPTNLLQNSSFQNNTNSWIDFGTEEVIDSASYDGDGKSVRMYDSHGDERSVYQDTSIGSGSMYLLRFAMKTSNLGSTGQARVKIEWLNSAGSVLSSTLLGNDYNNSAWAVKSVFITAPVGANRIRIRPTLGRKSEFGGANDAEVWYDAFELTMANTAFQSNVIFSSPQAQASVLDALNSLIAELAAKYRN